VVVGIGSEVPDTTRPERFRRKFGIDARYLIYVGRIDENKGCRELFDFFSHYSSRQTDVTLVVVGSALMPVPRHPRIRHLGYLSDEDKFDGIAGAELLMMPSYYESLSMVALEAWALGRPVLANGRCDVLRGQCIRSNAGLYYENGQEFVEALRVITDDKGMSGALGQNGRDYFTRHYTWKVIEEKYLGMLDRLERENRQPRIRPAMEPVPGWFGRRRRNLPPAREVVGRLPAGPVMPEPELADQIA
jgi:glycosyltransferase involved in cell wall biosynthesis